MPIVDPLDFLPSHTEQPYNLTLSVRPTSYHNIRCRPPLLLTLLVALVAWFANIDLLIIFDFIHTYMRTFDFLVGSTTFPSTLMSFRWLFCVGLVRNTSNTDQAVVDFDTYCDTSVLHITACTQFHQILLQSSKNHRLRFRLPVWEEGLGAGGVGWANF